MNKRHVSENEMCTTSCKEKVKSYDTFGAPIGVTFKGEPTFKTVCGGAITLFIILLLGGNLGLNLFEFLTKIEY